MTLGYRQAAVHPAVRSSRVVRDEDVRLDRRPDAGQTAEIAAAKQVIYDGFKAAVAAGVPKEKAGILVDEQFGAAILRDARRKAFTPPARRRRADRTSSTSSTATTSPSTSKHFGRRSAKCSCATIPRAIPSLNERQAARLKRLSDYLHSKSRSRFMFELLVPAEKAQLDRVRRRQESRTIWSCARR